MMPQYYPQPYTPQPTQGPDNPKSSIGLHEASVMSLELTVLYHTLQASMSSPQCFFCGAVSHHYNATTGMMRVNSKQCPKKQRRLTNAKFAGVKAVTRLPQNHQTVSRKAFC